MQGNDSSENHAVQFYTIANYNHNNEHILFGKADYLRLLLYVQIVITLWQGH